MEMQDPYNFFIPEKYKLVAIAMTPFTCECMHIFMPMSCSHIAFCSTTQHMHTNALSAHATKGCCNEYTRSKTCQVFHHLFT